MANDVAKFLLNTPLYTDIEFTSESLMALYKPKLKVDGFCPRCKKETTFKIYPQHVPGGDPDGELTIGNRNSFDEAELVCSRDERHKIKFFYKISGRTLKKVGQYPSLADIAILETKEKYKVVLSDLDWSELYKAIGLAAHGEGIGSFVYLRRVFENLIKHRFEDLRAEKGWSEEEFSPMNISKKIDFLTDDLPEFMVENKNIYGIFSKAIHELNNQECLKFFELGKDSIFLILEDDLRKKQSLEMRKRLQKEIGSFSDNQSLPV